MTNTQLLTFLFPTLALNLTPGPDMFFVISRATKRGPEGALLAAAGLWLGYLFHITLVSMGLAALLTKFPHAFTLMKLLGGSYLLILGIKLLLQKKSGVTKNANNEGSIWEGVFVSALNPKVAIFFLAFLPQFITPSEGHPTFQLVLLGLIFSLTSTAVNMSAGLLALAVQNRKRSAKRVRGFSLEKVCGLAMMGMAMRLAFFQ